VSAKAKIYSPTRTAMQSGRAKTRYWVLEFTPTTKMVPDPLMGWNTGDTLQQIHIEFPSKEAAVAYAQKHQIPFELAERKPRVIKPKSYAANFAYNRRTAF